MRLYDNEIRNLCLRLLDKKLDADVSEAVEQIMGISDDWYNLVNNLSDNNINLTKKLNLMGEALDDIDDDEE